MGKQINDKDPGLLDKSVQELIDEAENNPAPHESKDKKRACLAKKRKRLDWVLQTLYDEMDDMESDISC